MTVHREQSVKREKTSKMQQPDVYYQLLSQHVSGIIFVLLKTGIMKYAVTHGLCFPEDGHNDARNILREKLIINI